MSVDLSKFVNKEVVVTHRDGSKRSGILRKIGCGSYCYSLNWFSYRREGNYTPLPNHFDIIHIELAEPMTKYEQLQTEIKELKALREKEDAKIKELQNEVDRLKKEEEKNKLPKGFDRKRALHCIKTQYRHDLAFLDWRSTPQGLDYWADIYHNRAPFTNAAIMQLQEWVIMSYQQEFEGK